MIVSLERHINVCRISDALIMRAVDSYLTTVQEMTHAGGRFSMLLRVR